MRNVVDFMFQQLLTQNATKDYQPRQELSEALDAFLRHRETSLVNDTIDSIRQILADKNANAVRVIVQDQETTIAVLASAIKTLEAEGSKDPSVLNLIKSLHALKDVTAAAHWD